MAKKGERLRPCRKCQTPIRFLKGSWKHFGMTKKGWHWVNEDGSHHRCTDFQEPKIDPLDEQYLAAMERDQ